MTGESHLTACLTRNNLKMKEKYMESGFREQTQEYLSARAYAHIYMCLVFMMLWGHMFPRSHFEGSPVLTSLNVYLWLNFVFKVKVHDY